MKTRPIITLDHKRGDWGSIKILSTDRTVADNGSLRVPGRTSDKLLNVKNAAKFKLQRPSNPRFLKTNSQEIKFENAGTIKFQCFAPSREGSANQQINGFSLH